MRNSLPKLKQKDNKMC